MHSERNKEEAETEVSEETTHLTQSSDTHNLSMSPVDQGALLATVPAKQFRSESRPRSARVKRVHTGERERIARKSESKSIMGGKEIQGSSDHAIETNQQALSTATFGLVNITQQCPSAVLQMPATPNPTVPFSIISDPAQEVISDYQSTALLDTVSVGQGTVSAPMTSNGFQEGEEKREYPRNGENGFPYVFAPGFVMDNHLVPLALVQPLWSSNTQALNLASLLQTLSSSAQSKTTPFQANSTGALGQQPVPNAGHSVSAEAPSSSSKADVDPARRPESLPAFCSVGSSADDSHGYFSASDKSPKFDRNTFPNVWPTSLNTGMSPNTVSQRSTLSVSDETCPVLHELSQKTVSLNLSHLEIAPTFENSDIISQTATDTSRQEIESRTKSGAIVLGVKNCQVPDLSNFKSDQKASNKSLSLGLEASLFSPRSDVELSQLTSNLIKTSTLEQARTGTTLDERPTPCCLKVLSPSSLSDTRVSSAPMHDTLRPMSLTQITGIANERNESCCPDLQSVVTASAKYENDSVLRSSSNRPAETITNGTNGNEALAFEVRKVSSGSDAWTVEQKCQQGLTLKTSGVRDDDKSVASSKDSPIDSDHPPSSTVGYQNRISIMCPGPSVTIKDSRQGSSVAERQDTDTSAFQDKRGIADRDTKAREQQDSRSVGVGRAAKQLSDIQSTSLKDATLNMMQQGNMPGSKQTRSVNMEPQGVQQQGGGIIEQQQAGATNSCLNSSTTQQHHNASATRQDSCASSTTTPAWNKTDGNVPSSQSRESESRSYSSKWISTVAAWLLAQPSPYSVSPRPVATVPGSLNPFTVNVSSPVLLTPASSASVVHSFSKLWDTVASTTTNPATAGQGVKHRRSQGKTKGKSTADSTANSLHDSTANSLHNLLTSSSGNRHSGSSASYCRDVRKDAMLFYSSSSTKQRMIESTDMRDPQITGKDKTESSHRCSLCSQEYFTLADLHVHMLAHKNNTTGIGAGSGCRNIDPANHRGGQLDPGAGDARNKCAVCSRVFTRSWLLKGHMRTHTGERPFRCTWPQCQRAFADKSNLRSHTLIHTTTAKSFTCPKCSRAFSQKRYLHKHMLEVCRII